MEFMCRKLLAHANCANTSATEQLIFVKQILGYSGHVANTLAVRPSLWLVSFRVNDGG